MLFHLLFDSDVTVHEAAVVRFLSLCLSIVDGINPVFRGVRML